MTSCSRNGSHWSGLAADINAFLHDNHNNIPYIPDRRYLPDCHAVHFGVACSSRSRRSDGERRPMPTRRPPLPGAGQTAGSASYRVDFRCSSGVLPTTAEFIRRPPRSSQSQSDQLPCTVQLHPGPKMLRAGRQL